MLPLSLHLSSPHLIQESAYLLRYIFFRKFMKSFGNRWFLELTKVYTPFYPENVLLLFSNKISYFFRLPCFGAYSPKLRFSAFLFVQQKVLDRRLRNLILDVHVQ